MEGHFYKFPSTPHLAVLKGNSVRGDKVLTDAEQHTFLRKKIIAEEKADGANLGISFDSSGNLVLRNRGTLIRPPYSGQWKKLSEWLPSRLDTFFDGLTDRLILFGEWCYARHSVEYNRLPDWFLGFDIFSKKEGRFFCVLRRNTLLRELKVVPVPEISQGIFTIAELQSLMSASQLGNRPAEGLYLRLDQGDWLKQRTKLVRPEFVQSIGEHWSRSAITPNRLAKRPYDFIQK
ncbi:DNA ligase [Desulfonema ishimotonii]|uniref:DNA ligase n=1 Tax=Desulfonema ishimotonii TaxID=45657 RepID=A0A401FV36_9BACT|nr:RNA ligase family protein [Desulfonema ishimotonii]GBC60829.1 DNA ligase [Desulfonema ishimotonii]